MSKSLSRRLTRRMFFQAFGFTFAGVTVGCGQMGQPRGKRTCDICGGLGTIMQKFGDEEMQTPCYFCKGTGNISR